MRFGELVGEFAEGLEKLVRFLGRRLGEQPLAHLCLALALVNGALEAMLGKVLPPLIFFV